MRKIRWNIKYWEIDGRKFNMLSNLVNNFTSPGVTNFSPRSRYLRRGTHLTVEHRLSRSGDEHRL